MAAARGQIDALRLQESELIREINLTRRRRKQADASFRQLKGEIREQLKEVGAGVFVRVEWRPF